VTTAYDVTTNTGFNLVGCSVASLSANPASSATRGTSVVFTGTATCLGTPQYRFWIRVPGGTWKMVQDYSSSATLTWSTTGLAAGTYQVEVDVRDVGSAASYETTVNQPYQLT
jgi:hypothetical protein